MKSSTLRRANLSREKMAVLQALAKRRYQTQETFADATIEPAKEKELDILWQQLRVHPKNDKSIARYAITGFVAGSLCTLILMTFINLTFKAINEPAEFTPTSNAKSEKTLLTFIPADKKNTQVEVQPLSETYTVKSGDTLESIIIRFYGSFDLDKVEKIREANAMSNPNALQIGQKLTIPLE